MPASLSALATTLAPRSCPSSPGLATTTRMGGVTAFIEGRGPRKIARFFGVEARAWQRRRGWVGSPSRDQTEAAVLFDELRVSLGRITVASGAGQLEGDHVAAAEVDRGLAA